MPVEDDLLELVHNHEAAAGKVVEAARNSLSAPLRDFQGWYDHSAIRSLAERLAALLTGFERVAARNADAYMARAITASTGRRFAPVGVRNTPFGRNGIDNPSVLGRIANAYRWQQAQFDKGFIQAATSEEFLTGIQDPRDAAYDRLDKIVQTNLQMAQRGQMRTTMAEADGVTGFRRIVHPELSSEGSCGLCFAASDRHYSKGELLPIHPGCHCTELPITRSFDPHSINEVDFSKLYTDAGGTSAQSLRATRYKIMDHAEIGAVLAPEDQPIRTRADVKKAETRQSVKKSSDPLAPLIKRRDAMVNAWQKMDERSGNEADDVLQRARNRIDDLNAEIARLEAA